MNKLILLKLALLCAYSLKVKKQFQILIKNYNELSWSYNTLKTLIDNIAYTEDFFKYIYFKPDFVENILTLYDIPSIFNNMYLF